MGETMRDPCCRTGPSAVLIAAQRSCIVSGVLLLSACYTYRALHGPVPASGSHVSLRLSSDASRQFALQLGPGVSYIEGVVLADDSAGLHVAVSRVEAGGGGGSETPWVGERFTFPHEAYLSVEERHLSLPGTLFVGGLAVGAVVALTEAFNAPGALNTQPGGTPNPTQ
jgi:hypothetical protein